MTRPVPDLVFLGHAVDRSGPPVYLLHLLRWLSAHTDRQSLVVSLEGGPLASEYERLATLEVVGEPNAVRLPRRGRRPVTAARDRLRGRRVRAARRAPLVHVNTVWSGRALRYLPRLDGRLVTHVHELSVGLEYHLPARDRAALLERTDHWIAASGAVAAELHELWGVPADTITVHHEMIDTTAADDPALTPGPELRRRWGLPPEAELVGTLAVVNWRKGPDHFVRLAARLRQLFPDRDLHFPWIGVLDDPATTRLRDDVRRAGLGDRIHLVPVSDRPMEWLRALGVFVLTAREDAYPLAALEAAACGVPVVCFRAGGMPELVGTDAGAVVDYPDVDAMARSVIALLDDPGREAGRVARRRVVERHDVGRAAPRLWADLERWARG